MTRAMTRYPKLQQQGFTIIELMIATIVFAVILLVVSAGVMRFTTDFYKSINTSTTQNAGRNAIAGMSEAIEFSTSVTSSPPATGSTVGYVCAGNEEFAYVLGNALPNTAGYGLYRFKPTGGCGPVGVPASSTPGWGGGQELLGAHMRLVYLDVEQADTTDPTSIWNISLKVAYGENDLICSPSLGSAAGGCNANAAQYPATLPVTAADVQCRPSSGSQFCSMVSLHTGVAQRLVGP